MIKDEERHALDELLSRRRQRVENGVQEKRRLGTAASKKGQKSLQQQVTTLTLLAKCPEWGTLTRREIAALAGVAPLAKESGKHRGKRFIWGGRADVRAVLYMAALTARGCNPAIKTFAERLAQAGKPPKVVIVACMRKLLTIMRGCFQNANNMP